MWTESGKHSEARQVLDQYYQETQSEKMNPNHLGTTEVFNIIPSSGEPPTFVEYLFCARLFDATSRGGSLVFPWPLNSPGPD